LSSTLPTTRSRGPDGLAELLRAVGAGDERALEQLYSATSSKLLAVCLRILSDRAESEDVLQDVYVTVWRRAGTFDPARAAPMTWLSTVARNRAIDRLRARGPASRSEPLDGFDAPDPQPLADASLEAAQESGRLFACLDELEARTAAAIRTAFLEGVTYEALAQRWEAPLGTVKSWIRRGLQKLRGCLER
jgi:RNA polymerase sigma-70 factor (ECF subfamily)